MTVQQGKQMLLPQGKHKEDFIHYCPSAGRCPCTFWKTRSHHRFLRDKMPWSRNAMTCFLLLSSSFCYGAWWHVVWNAFGEFGSAVLAATALRLMLTPGKQPENLSAVPCSAAAETLLYYWHWPRHKPKHITIQAAMRKVNSLTPLVWWFLMMNEIILGKNPCCIEEDSLKHTSRSGAQNSCIAHNWCANVLLCSANVLLAKTQWGVTPEFFPMQSWCMNWSRCSIGTCHLWALVLQSFHTLLWFYCSSMWCRRTRESLKYKRLG